MTNAQEISQNLPRSEDTLDGIVRKNAVYRPDGIAFRHRDSAVDWRSFDRLVSGCAFELAGRGITPGDRIGFLVPNSIDAYVAMLGAMRAGAMIVPFSTMLDTASLVTLLTNAECKLLLADRQLADLAASVSQNVTIAELADFTGSETERFESLARADAPASIIYSSGTTGLPKGAVHTHAARALAGLMSAFGFDYQSRSKTFLTTPPYTNGSWMMVLPSLISGSELILASKFDVDDVFDVVAKHAPTHAFFVPTQFQALVDSKQYSSEVFSPFRCLITAGAPMPVKLKQQILADAPGRLYELWGLTEVVATISSPWELHESANSVGRPLPLSEIRLIDEDDCEIDLPGTGEIVARSQYQMIGYWGQPELNASIQWIGRDGASFMRTGDIGEIDAQGRLYIRGRIKDMIISGGINVYPADIEDKLREHPAISDAAVIGVADEKWGEVPVAFVRLRAGSDDTPESMLHWSKAHLAKFQRISEIIASADDFPRNTLGKVLKNDLRDQYRALVTSRETKGPRP